jgi:hypothetical protein
MVTYNMVENKAIYTSHNPSRSVMQ